VQWQDAPPARLLTALTLTGSDLKAVNSFDAPKHVVPQDLNKPTTSSSHSKFEVPACSYTVVQWGA